MRTAIQVFRSPFNTATVQRLDIQNRYLSVYLYCQVEVSNRLFNVKKDTEMKLQEFHIELLKADEQI